MPFTISESLINSYYATTYIAHSGSWQIRLRIGEQNTDLMKIHQSVGVSSSVFITACNPFGEDKGETFNKAVMSKMSGWFDRAGIAYLKGSGGGGDGEWPPEPSLLVFGVSHSKAVALCRLFRQNAVVYCNDDGVPRLLLHPHAQLES